MPLTLPRFLNVEQFRRAAANNPPLSSGSKGDGVQAVQIALVELGFAMPRSTENGTALPDGIFGSETKAVVEAFQRANGLKVDGYAGTHTLEKLDTAIGILSATRSAAGTKPPVRRAFV